MNVILERNYARLSRYHYIYLSALDFLFLPSLLVVQIFLLIPENQRHLSCQEDRRSLLDLYYPSNRKKALFVFKIKNIYFIKTSALKKYRIPVQRKKKALFLETGGMTDRWDIDLICISSDCIRFSVLSTCASLSPKKKKQTLQWTNIKFCVGKSATKTYEKKKSAYGEEAISRSGIHNLFSRSSS